MPPDQSQEPAVFSRNHDTYLRQASALARRSATRLVTFRSNGSWTGARRLLQSVGSMPIYFAPVDGAGLITHRATLRQVYVGHMNAPEAKVLLESRLRSTRGETNWNSEGTLYAISGCARVRPPFAFSALHKLSDSKRISPGFRYSYCLVHARDRVPVARDLAAIDLGPPTATVRANTHVSRVIRDTRTVQRLKALHRDTCQLCRKRLALSAGRAYSEGHHLRPLGTPHNGPDHPSTILILCPNCHALCDLGAVRLSPARVRSHRAHQVDRRFLAYHNRVVYRHMGGHLTSA